MVQFVLEHGLRILSGQSVAEAGEDGWTCRRTMDGALAQLDFILAGGRVQCHKTSYDNCLPIGLDHRCVHGVEQLRVQRDRSTIEGGRKRRQKSFKKWKPKLDERGQPQYVQDDLSMLVLEHGSTASFEQVEAAFQDAATKFGYTATHKLRSCPNSHIQALRAQRRRSHDQAECQQLSFEIRRLQRQESGARMTTQVEDIIKHSEHWHEVKTLL
ncbi:unnamed protein product [Prorocentrum cordatum]|uniref:Uncharacterized protein n=1 Tax=Prorocentrum cordatum TaxID=2364126 RepID=A0ABN9VHQ2_9DINO|nr:unnamed protein product [Polarella glacialis]